MSETPSSNFPLGTSSQLLLGLGGMSILTSVLDKTNDFLHSTLGLELKVLVSFFFIGTMFYAGFQQVFVMLKEFLMDYYSCVIRIPSEDQLFSALLEYLESQRTFGTKEELDEHVERRRVKAAKQKANIAKNLAKTNSFDVTRPVASEREPMEEANVFGAANSNGKLAWYARFSRESKNYDANLDSYNNCYVTSDSEDDGSDSEGEVPEANQKQTKKRVKYSPTPGFTQYIYYKPTKSTIAIWRMEHPEANAGWFRKPRETLYLSVYGRDLTPVRTLLQEIVNRSTLREMGRTTIFRATQSNGGPYWDRCFSRAVRSIDSVILDESQKEEIIADIDEYLMPATARWYANRGLPYRRGYLLYGPPGTGKTSLTVAIAGKFNLKIYSLALSNTWMNDDNLANLFSTLPKSCIVLLEDIDACGVTNNRDLNKDTSTPRDPANTASSGTTSTTSSRSSVTLSGLLNAIDGVASKEGRVLIMTTNHRELLDDALIRPGRVDLQIKFSNMKKEGVYALFRKLYDVDATDRAVLRFPTNFPDEERLKELASKLSEIVPEDVFSPADLQGFLLKWKKNPTGAVEEAPKWVVEAIKEKKVKAKAEAEKREREREEREKEMERKKAEEVEKKENGKGDGDKDEDGDGDRNGEGKEESKGGDAAISSPKATDSGAGTLSEVGEIPTQLPTPPPEVS